MVAIVVDGVQSAACLRAVVKWQQGRLDAQKWWFQHGQRVVFSRGVAECIAIQATSGSFSWSSRLNF